ncbi:MAG: ATP-binding protein [Actinomycetota bacterium]
MRVDLPSGTVTFLFTDVEGSTRLLHEIGAERYSDALLHHRRVMRDAFERHGGVEVDTQGDAFFVAFPSAQGALDAAREAASALAHGPILVRMGLHTGSPYVSEEGYVGEDVHLGARIASAGHGGQILLSKATREVVECDVTDLGEHRLKDFERPVPILQLGDERFPPLKTISNTNLPRPASSFVGRDAEVQEVVALVRGGARLVTLTGPGGSGKTRLGIESASELVPDFKAGVFWVGLASLRDPALVVDAVAQTLGAKEGLAEHIGERELLLLVDNLEQVIEAAPELASLVENCPNLSMLVTSRESMRVRGEVGYEVLPLADPEAAQLFSARARVELDDTVRTLCRAIDNLPLAIELAAARVSALTPAQILERLSQRLDLLKGGRDADPRQQTLRATIAWSHELLDERERRLFARLSVFSGGCTLGSAEEVVDADLDTLQSLVEKSLVRRTGDRFWMLETIREYATERLEASGEADECRRFHAEHFVSLAEEAEPYLREESKEWLDRLEGEHDNLRAALEVLESSGASELVLRLAGAASMFWSMRFHLLEGRRRVESALGSYDWPTAARARALLGAADLAIDTGDAASVRRWGDEALTLHRSLGDRWGVAYALLVLGHAAADQDEPEKAKQLFEEAADAFRDLGDRHHWLLATRLIAWMYDTLGDRTRARATHEENLARARALGNAPIMATTLGALSSYAADEGRIEDAVSLAAESVRMYRELGDLGGIAIELCRCADVTALMGRSDVAARLLGSSEALREEIGLSVRPWLGSEIQRTLTRIRGDLDDSVFALEWDRGRKLTPDAAVSLALESLV